MSMGDATSTEALDLDAIRTRAEAAAGGPWSWFAFAGPDHARELLDSHNDWVLGPSDSASVYIERADADFIAHAREDVPALIAEVERLRGLLALGVSEGREIDVEAALRCWYGTDPPEWSATSKSLMAAAIAASLGGDTVSLSRDDVENALIALNELHERAPLIGDEDPRPALRAALAALPSPHPEGTR